MTSAPQTTGVADLSGRVDIVEVGARDGLQNEDVPLESAVKVDLIERIRSDRFVRGIDAHRLADVERFFASD